MTTPTSGASRMSPAVNPDVAKTLAVTTLQQASLGPVGLHFEMGVGDG